MQRKNGKILVLLLIALTTTTNAVTEELFNVDVFFGWGGCYRPMEWTPVEVNIQSELTGITQINFSNEAEKDLAKMLIRYDQAIAIAAEECRPNYLTSYLYDLAQTFSRFYNACPVLKANPVQRPVRLLLCDLTARTIKHGLSELLGIEVVKQM